MQDHRRLKHFHHEGRFSARYIVRCTYTGEYLVAISYFSCRCRHETSHLSHQHNQSSLTQKGRFTGHVRTGQYYDLLVAVIQIYIIRNKLLTYLHLSLDYRMTSLLYIYNLTVIHLRTAISVADSQIRESAEDIKTCKNAAVPLDGRNICLYSCHQFAIYARLYCIYTLLRSENLLLIFLQFLGYISFRIHEGLLPYPLGRNAVLMCVTDFKVISENVIETYLERRYSCALYLTLLNLKKIVLAVTSDSSEFVKFLIHS